MVDSLCLHCLCRVKVDGLIVGGLAQVACVARGDVVEVDVRVGRHGIVDACLFAAGVSDKFRVGTPVELLHSSERCHWTLVRLVLKHVYAFVNTLLCDVSYKGVGYALHIMIPVAVVEVGNQSSCCQRQVLGVLLYALVVRQRLDEDDLLAVG